MKHTVHNAAIIGCGFIAYNKHLPALQNLADRVSLAAFCDIEEDRAAKAAADYGIPKAKICTDYRLLLDDPDIDIVYVLTPNRSHREISIAALQAGKHVMCEKPMAKTFDEARDMCDAAKASGHKFTIGYQYRCDPEPLQLKRIIDDGVLGDIYVAQAHAYRRRGIPNWGVFLNEYEQGGGALIDIGTHALDMALWLMDNYKPQIVLGKTYQKLGTASCVGNKFGPWDTSDFDVEDSAFGFIVMENGATINLGASWALNSLDTREQKVTLCGTLAGADMDDGLRINGVAHDGLYETHSCHVIGSNPNNPQIPTAADLDAIYWLDAIDNDTPTFVLPEQALVVTQILEAIYQSSKSGKAVYL